MRNYQKSVRATSELLRDLKTLQAIQDLVKDDPVLALAKIRIEIEKLITKLHVSLDLKSNFNRHTPLARMIVDLNRQEILSSEISHALREVLAICNRAVHGEEIRKQDAEIIVKTGTELLEFLYSEVPLLITSVTKSEENISEQERDDYMTAKYQITSIIPLVETPKKCVRILTQEGLNEYLDGYNEFAEFIIDIKKVEEK